MPSSVSKKTPAARKRAPAAPASKRSSASSSRRDAITLLTKDHKDVKKLFGAYKKLVKAEADAEERRALATQICEMLTVHATVEEEIFYPAARAALKDQDLLDEAEVEHATAKDLIAQIEAASPDDELYDAKVKVLGEYIDHHVQEEEGDLFPKVKRARLDLVELGAELAARKEELTAAEEVAA